MKQRRAFRKFVATAIGVTALLMMTQTAFAQVVKSPRLARTFDAWLTRAMDDCVLANDAGGPTVTIVGTPNVPQYGCLQQNVTTDSVLNVTFGRLHIDERGRVVVFATGFVMGDKLAVKLTLRSTRLIANVKHPPSSNARVTFIDDTVTCPTMVARPNGLVTGVTSLAACLGSTSGLSSPTVGKTNLEILDLALVNANCPGPLCGKVVGVPGVLRK